MKKSDQVGVGMILVVDDDELTRLAIGYALRAGGQPASVGCSDGTEAREILSHGIFSAVILDLFMPHVSGWQILTWVRANRPSLPVIVVSGYDSSLIREECLRDGAFDYLVKPIDERRLMNCIQRALETPPREPQPDAFAEAATGVFPG
jgi:DNA-binding NtrC family response regulator